MFLRQVEEWFDLFHYTLKFNEDYFKHALFKDCVILHVYVCVCIFHQKCQIFTQEKLTAEVSERNNGSGCIMCGK